MRKLCAIFIGLSTTLTLSAQTIVNTGAGKKHVILEEFSGINCVACPAGHKKVEEITAANAGLVHVVAYAPFNSGYTNPGSGGTDFRRSFADAFYTSSYCSPGDGRRYMPSGFINRKLTGGNVLQGSGNWTSQTGTALNEAADLNVGLKSTYDAGNQKLVIDVEVYYLSNLTAGNNLCVLITEDDLTSPKQSGSSATAANPYAYKHIFRESVTTGQWGDPITGPTTQGSTYTNQLIFDLSKATDPINIAKAHVVAFVINDNSSNKEIYSGISAIADGGQASSGEKATGIDEIISEKALSIYPNPTSSISTLSFYLSKNTNVRMDVYNSLGSVVYTENNMNMIAGNQKINFDASELPEGMYFINLAAGNQKITRKLSLLK